MRKIEYSIPAVKSLLAMSSSGSEDVEIPDDIAGMSDEDFDKMSHEDFEKAVGTDDSDGNKDDDDDDDGDADSTTDSDNDNDDDDLGDDNDDDNSDTDTKPEPTPKQGETGSEVVEGEDKESEGQPTEMSDEQKAEAVRTYELLFGSPIKASGREVQLKSPEHAKNFIEMGVDYNKKMQHMRPYKETFETLKKEGLLDPEKRERLNLLLEVEKGNKDALKRLIAESDMDPLDLADEDVISQGKEYVPNDHILSESQTKLQESLSEIKETQSYERTLNTITKDFDEKSREVIGNNPEYIVSLNNDIENGVFDQVMDVVNYRKDMRQVPTGMSDMDLYIATVRDMAAYEQQQLAEQANGQEQPASQKQRGSNRKKKIAMSGNKSSKSSKKKDYDPMEIFDMSDADFDKKFPNIGL